MIHVPLVMEQDLIGVYLAMIQLQCLPTSSYSQLILKMIMVYARILVMNTSGVPTSFVLHALRHVLLAAVPKLVIPANHNTLY